GRLKRSIPEELHEHLKLPLVQSPGDAEEFDVHFAEQKTPIFLLDEPESRAAMFFSASSDAGRLLEIQERHREKSRDKKLLRKTCEIDNGVYSDDGTATTSRDTGES